jgi:hypothetical protein
MGSWDQAENLSVTAPNALILEMPLGLAVIFGIAAILWYELLRSAVVRRVARRRRKGEHLRRVNSLDEAELAEGERETAEQDAAEASEPDLARRLYFLARKTATAERDLAILAASELTERAIKRIEDRYGEITKGLDDEETRRLGCRSERKV